MTKKARIVWRVGEKPTGPYRSFHYRSWPSASYPDKDGRLVAYLHAGHRVSYHPSEAETTILTVRVMNYKDEKPEWRQLKIKPVGVTAAKELVAEFFKQHPDWLPA